MKKTLKFIILLLIGLFININKVDAKTFKLYEEGHTDVGSVNLYRYYINGDDGNKVTLYCRDGGLFAPTVKEGGHEDGIEMSATPLDPSNAHDAGLIEIMEYGKANGFSYEAINMAIRFYEYTFGRVDVVTKQRDSSETAINDRDEVIVNIVDNIRLAEKYVSQWFNDSDLSAAGAKMPYNAIAGDKTYKGWIESYGKSTSTDGVYLDSERISISQIQELLQAGINEAKNVLTGNSTTRTETSITKPFEPLIKDYSDDAMYIKEITYTFSTKGFDTKKDSILMKFNCEECENYKIDYKIKIEGNDISGTDLDDIKAGKLELIDKYVDKENDTLEVILTFSAIKSTFDCANKPNYSIEFKYTGEQKRASYAQYDFPGRSWSDQVYIGDHWEIVTGSEDGGSVSGGTGGSAGENNDDKDYPGIYVETGKVELCEYECEALKNKCDKYKEENPWDSNYNVNNESCKKYVELKCDPGDDTPEEELAKCNVYVSSATCSETPSELTIREGTGGNSPCDDSGVSVYGCVTRKGAADNNGNEYKQTTMQPNNAYSTTFDSGAFDVSDNRFCNVACIENYRITLPPAQNDNAGRYFQLSANIEGNKSCYTSKIKKGDQTNPLSSNNAGTFEYMFEEERLKNEEYYYMYSFYKAIQDAIANDNKAITDKTKTHTSQYINTYTGWTGTTNEYKNYYEYTLNFVDGNASSRFFDNYIVGSNSLDGIGIYAYYSKSENNIFNPSNKLIKYEYKDVSSNKCNITSANKDACYLSVPYFTIQCKKGNNNQVTCTIRSYSYPYQDGYSGSETTDGLLSLEKILGNKEIYNDKSKSFNYDFLNNIYGNSFDYTKYGTNISTASNGMTSTITNMKLYTKELAQCVGWDMKFKFNPTLTFDYEEEYINNDNVKKQLEADSDGDASDNEITVPEEVEYCKDEMTYDDDGKYKSCSGTIDKNKLYNERKVLLYSVDNNVINNTTPTSFFISDALTAYQKIDVAQNYSTPVQFRTLSPSGVIVLMDSNNQQIDDSLIIPGWPIEFAHQGVFTYKISVKDLGEYNSGINNGKLGRIWDDDEQNVVKKAEADKASTCGSNKSTIDKDGNYFCSYKVNCNDCPSECDPNIGICEDPDCPDCPSSCNPNKGACIVDGELNVSPRPVSPNNVNPNNRPLGKNWAWDDNIDTYLELKAFVTTQEIQESGENIFDVDFDAEYTESNVIGNNYAVKFNLTSDVINYIKGYNQGKTYSDNSLDCYPYTNEATNETFDGMFCYSKFIDKLIEEKPDAVQIKGTRPEPAARASLTNHSWWTTWDQAESSIDHWQTGPITYSIDKTLSNIHFATDSESQIGIGPAWK